MFRTPVAILVLVVGCSQAFGQGFGLSYSVRTKSYEGEIKEVRGNRIIWETDGKTGPIPYDRTTTLSVTATGDAGFVTPNAVVTISGTLRPDKSIVGATMQVHLNPNETGGVGRVTVNEADPQIRVKGRLISFEPLTIKAIDGISMTSVGSNNRSAAPSGPPIYGAVLTVKLRDPKPETVSLLLGSAPKLIAAGDLATVTVAENNPKVARSVRIRKLDELKSGRKKPEGDKPAADDAKKPVEEAKPEDGKPTDGKPEAEMEKADGEKTMTEEMKKESENE